MVNNTRIVKDICLKNTVRKSIFTFQSYENVIFQNKFSKILLYLETGNYKNSKCTN